MVQRLNNNFGYIRLNLKYIMDKNNISINQLHRITNVRYEVIRKYYNGDCFWIDLTLLAKLCYVFKCNINDLLIYECKSTNSNLIKNK